MRIATCCLWAALLLVVASKDARAQANDDWVNRTAIVALPFEVVTPMGSATNDASDPLPNCQGTGQASSGTIWFGYTTGGSPEILTLRVADFQVATVLAVYAGAPGEFKLAPGACARAGGSPNNAQLAGVRLAANTAYSILLSAQSPTGSGQTVAFSVATAAVYNVTKTDDTFDGVCDADCSLREAIQAANAVAGAVIVPAGTYMLSLGGSNENANATGDLDVLDDMGVYGAGTGQTVIDANSIDRVFDVVSLAEDANTLILGDLTLTHGAATIPQSPKGGAILSESLSPGFIGLERVALVGNHASQGGGGIDTSSAGTIRDSRITLNVVDTGGAGGGGAALLNPQDRPFDIESSTFDANNGGDTGGAIQTYGNLRLANSTISGNHVAQYGAGIRVANGLFEMASTTVAFNKAGSDAFLNLGGGLFLTSSSNYTMYNNIIAGNLVDDCLIYTFAGGAIESHHNHIQAPGQDATACSFAGPGDVVGSDPQLDPRLADNGGPTPTHALGFKSPARDTGDPAGCNAPDGLALATDQRGAGFPRLDGPACDKGAYEQQVLFANGFEQ
jgi:CSLREA domain-containing protein